MDQSCIEVCPVDCIYYADDDRMCFIEPDQCIDCAVCEAACPVGAIFRDTEVPADAADFTEINALWFSDADAARARVEAFADSGPSIT
jgi:NAD-dependent dihydropyrimidine dehydrogenase PreA subunit